MPNCVLLYRPCHIEPFHFATGDDGIYVLQATTTEETRPANSKSTHIRRENDGDSDSCLAWEGHEILIQFSPDARHRTCALCCV